MAPNINALKWGIVEEIGKLGYTPEIFTKVLDWRTDFLPGRTILDQIEQASARSVAGIFLLTRDHEVPDDCHAAGDAA